LTKAAGQGFGSSLPQSQGNCICRWRDCAQALPHRHGRLSRPSTSLRWAGRTWMPGTSPGMTSLRPGHAKNNDPHIR